MDHKESKESIPFFELANRHRAFTEIDAQLKKVNGGN
jgi:hypothetical protein